MTVEKAPSAMKVTKAPNFCTGCGKQLRETARFCTACGKEATASDPAPSMPIAENVPATEPMTVEPSPVVAIQEAMPVSEPVTSLEAPIPEALPVEPLPVVACEEALTESSEAELLAVLSSVAPEAVTSMPQARYTYKVLSKADERMKGRPTPTAVEALLNAYAAEGWRVVSFQPIDWHVPAADFLAVLEKEL